MATITPRTRRFLSYTAAIGTLTLLATAASSLQGRAAQRQAKTAAPSSHVLALGNFSHIVADLDRSVAFYRTGLGLEPAGPVRPFEANAAIQRAANVMGAETRYVVMKVPGSTLGVELIEYKDIDRRPV